jgi:hypothetical protein
MRPKKHETTGTSDLFRARLDQIINMKHELVQLAGKIDWDWLDREIALPHLHIHRSRSSNANCLCGAVLAVPAQLSLNCGQYCPVNLKGVGQKANSGAAFRVTRRVSDLNGK